MALAANPTFSRASVAYNPDGSQVAVNVPRYQTGKFGQAVMVEEGTTNLIKNASFEVYTGTNGVADGWGSWTDGTNVTASFSVDTTVYRPSGVKSQKIAITASTATNSDYSAIVGQGGIAAVAGNSITGSAYIQGISTNTDVAIALQAFDSTGAFLGNFAEVHLANAASWTRISVSGTAPTNTATVKMWVGLRVTVAGGTGTLYVDDAQLELKPYATSVIIAADTTTQAVRSSETLTAPYMQFNNISFSVETWFKAPLDNGQPGGDQPILSQDDSNATDKFLHLTIRNGIPHFGFYGDDLDGTKVVTDNNWHFICFAFDSITKTQYIYVDGVLDTSRVATSVYLGAVGNTDIGWVSWGAYTDGLIDDLRISSVARSASDILAAHNSGAPLPVDQYTTYKLPFDDSLVQSPRPWIPAKTNWTAQDYLNYGDFDRIEFNCDALATLFQTCGYNLSLVTNIIRAMSSLDFYDDLNRIEGNILAIFNLCGVNPTGWVTPKTTWSYDQVFSYTDVNRMEGNELTLYNMVSGIIQEYPICGQGFNICGVGWYN